MGYSLLEGLAYLVASTKQELLDTKKVLKHSIESCENLERLYPGFKEVAESVLIRKGYAFKKTGMVHTNAVLAGILSAL